MYTQRRIARGVIAGMAGGLVASWAMNEFMSRAGKKLEKAVQTDEQNEADRVQQRETDNQPKEDATMKAADRVMEGVTGGQHLSWRQKEKSGPIVHYAFGMLMGGAYGGLAELAPGVAAGAGISFGTVLFAGADLLAVPALGLSQSSASQPASKLATPFAAHLVYGLTADIVRRLLR